MHYEKKTIIYELFFSKEKSECQNQLLPFLKGLENIILIEEEDEDIGETYLITRVLVPKKYKILIKEGKGFNDLDGTYDRVQIKICGEDSVNFEKYMHQFFGTFVCIPVKQEQY